MKPGHLHIEPLFDDDGTLIGVQGFSCSDERLVCWMDLEEWAEAVEMMGECMQGSRGKPRRAS